MGAGVGAGVGSVRGGVGAGMGRVCAVARRHAQSVQGCRCRGMGMGTCMGRACAWAGRVHRQGVHMVIYISMNANVL
jgi:hypothetical protein